MGTMGAAIPLRVPVAATRVADAVKQIGTPRSPDPIMRRPSADREEKRETHGRDDSRRTEKGFENRLKKARSSLTEPTPIREDSQTIGILCRIVSISTGAQNRSITS